LAGWRHQAARSKVIFEYFGIAEGTGLGKSKETFPDLPGCMGDGETAEAAIEDGYSAAKAWLNVAEECPAAAPVLTLPKGHGSGWPGRFTRLAKNASTWLRLSRFFSTTCPLSSSP